MGFLILHMKTEYYKIIFINEVGKGVITRRLRGGKGEMILRTIKMYIKFYYNKNNRVS